MGEDQIWADCEKCGGTIITTREYTDAEKQEFTVGAVIKGEACDHCMEFRDFKITKVRLDVNNFAGT